MPKRIDTRRVCYSEKLRQETREKIANRCEKEVEVHGNCKECEAKYVCERFLKEVWSSFPSFLGCKLSDEDLFDRFVADLEKMNPPWKTWRLTLTCGINIRRESGELIRMFRMWDERYWNVYVFIKNIVGFRYRDAAHNKLTLKEAVALVQKYITEINKTCQAKVLNY